LLSSTKNLRDGFASRAHRVGNASASLDRIQSDARSIAACKVASRTEYQKRAFMTQLKRRAEVATFGAFLCAKTRAFIFVPKAKGFDEF
jgi:hypothetical protein